MADKDKKPKPKPAKPLKPVKPGQPQTLSGGGPRPPDND